jgi:hypothetical protein
MNPLRVAMWSGPRNLSTAMMRAWENRGDCAVSDEPLYAHYLEETGLDHPAREEVIAAGETDWRCVAAALAKGPSPGDSPVWYQKHMSHHLLPHIDVGWIAHLRNVLLIRDPRLVVASYVKSRATVTPDDIGVPQQGTLYDVLSAHAEVPVIDAGEFLRAPEAHLRALCAWLGIAFTPRMLAWPAGPRDSDGVWAPHWYERVWASTGFEAAPDEVPSLQGHYADVAAVCMPIYERLRAARLRVETGSKPA